MIRVAVVGIGKMGLSHHALFNAHPDVDLAAVCDSSRYLLGVLRKYTGIATYTDYSTMLREVALDAVVIATPSRTHVQMVRAALDEDIHVFCEKPLTLDAVDAAELARRGSEKGLVTQVGYHNRFVASFSEVKRLVEMGAIGTVTHGLGEAYGAVVLEPSGSTWRSKREEGGGCLYDYAAHPIDLLTWYLGDPVGVGGTILHSIFSRDVDDEVFSTLIFDGGRSAQISVNWSDDSQRKMTTRVTLWGTEGKIYADRQECQVYLRSTATAPDGYHAGWNVRYTTELTEPVWFYLRGEEYSAQVDAFVTRVSDRTTHGVNAFASAAVTDRVIAMMIKDAAGETSVPSSVARVPRVRARRWRRNRDGGG